MTVGQQQWDTWVSLDEENNIMDVSSLRSTVKVPVFSPCEKVFWGIITVKDIVLDLFYSLDSKTVTEQNGFCSFVKTTKNKWMQTKRTREYLRSKSPALLFPPLQSTGSLFKNY